MIAGVKQQPVTPRPVVKKQGRQWGVYLDGVLVEGGFFRRDAADACADALLRELGEA